VLKSGPLQPSVACLLGRHDRLEYIVLGNKVVHALDGTEPFLPFDMVAMHKLLVGGVRYFRNNSSIASPTIT
jgi:hypothetical protein